MRALLPFRVGSDPFSLDAALVREVIGRTPSSPSPAHRPPCPASFRGRAARCRGGSAGGPRAAGASRDGPPPERVLVLHVASVTLALFVDEVREVDAVAPEHVRPAHVTRRRFVSEEAEIGGGSYPSSTWPRWSRSCAMPRPPPRTEPATGRPSPSSSSRAGPRLGPRVARGGRVVLGADWPGGRRRRRGPRPAREPRRRLLRAAPPPRGRGRPVRAPARPALRDFPRDAVLGLPGLVLRGASADLLEGLVVRGAGDPVFVLRAAGLEALGAQLADGESFVAEGGVP